MVYLVMIYFLISENYIYLTNMTVIASFGWADKSANSHTCRHSHTWKFTYINTIVTTKPPLI